jgi:hypothetical protein
LAPGFAITGAGGLAKVADELEISGELLLVPKTADKGASR